MRVLPTTPWPGLIWLDPAIDVLLPTEQAWSPRPQTSLRSLHKLDCVAGHDESCFARVNGASQQLRKGTPSASFAPHEIIAHTRRRMRKSCIRVLAGDKVLAPHDLTGPHHLPIQIKC